METEQTETDQDLNETNQEVKEAPVTSEYELITDGLTYKELHELRHHITCRMTDLRNSGITQLRATIAEQATILGIDIRDLVPKKQKQKQKQKRHRRTKAEMEAARREADYAPPGDGQ